MSDMKIITEPTVYLVGHQEVFAPGLQRFLENNGVQWETDTEAGAEYLSEAAGRVCYMSFAKPRPGGNKTYLDHILEVGHGSVLEHGVWNFIVEGVSRSFSHEMVRHRAGWSYSQLSQRYVDESVAEYVVPGFFANDPEMFLVWKEACYNSHQAYMALVDMGLRKIVTPLYNNYLAEVIKEENATGVQIRTMPYDEWWKSRPQDMKTAFRKEVRAAARSVLPNATETKIFFTVNARAARHFIEMRCSQHAEREIRVMAGKLLFILAAEAPHLFGDYKMIPLPDGTFEAQTPYRKV